MSDHPGPVFFLFVGLKKHIYFYNLKLAKNIPFFQVSGTGDFHNNIHNELMGGPL